MATPAAMRRALAGLQEAGRDARTSDRDHQQDRDADREGWPEPMMCHVMICGARGLMIESAPDPALERRPLGQGRPAAGTPSRADCQACAKGALERFR